MQTIGDRMVILRAKKRWTQAQLAEAMGENTATIFRFENAKTKPHKAVEVRVDLKLKELEEKENEQREENQTAEA